MEKNIGSWFEKHKIVTVSIVMLIIWFSLLTFFFLKADEVTKDPCNICAENLGHEVICTVGTLVPITQIYYENGSISNNEEEASSKFIRNQTSSINFAGLGENFTFNLSLT